MTLAEASWAIALSQEGVEEQPRGSNDGPEVRDYLACVHLPPGNAWCAAFVTWCIYRAVGQVGGPPQFCGSGSALGLLRVNPELVVAAPTDGGVYVAVHADEDNVHGHAFFIRATLVNEHYSSLEGNTNDDGSREGYKVCQRTRSSAEIKAYLRIG